MSSSRPTGCRRTWSAVASSRAPSRSAINPRLPASKRDPEKVAVSARRDPGRTFGDLFRATEIDARLVGMLGALALIWIGVDLLSGGAFLTPRNLWNLSVQTASVAVM